MEDQILDNMDWSASAASPSRPGPSRCTTRRKTARDYELNLIDTPGHVDFNYEVSRSLAACEGAVLVVDATQGVEAQTLANTYLAMEHDLEILPVINKIDLPAPTPPGWPSRDRGHHRPARHGRAGDLRQAGHQHRRCSRTSSPASPPPRGAGRAPLQALIFDSQYDSYRGVIVYLRVMEGTSPGATVRMMATGAQYEVVECGHLLPRGWSPARTLEAGEVGYLTASIKNVGDTRWATPSPGRTAPPPRPCRAIGRCKPMVFCGIYTRGRRRLPRSAGRAGKAALNDASLSFEPETSAALGFGFRCGFLGLLHMEIIQERLEREFDLDLVTTLPSVIYHVDTRPTAPWSRWTTPTTTPTPPPSIARGGALRQGHHHHAPRLCGQHHALCQERAASTRTCSTWTQTWWSSSLRDAPQRDHLRLFRHAQGQHPGLRQSLDYEIIRTTGPASS
jgi:GTP-binding protein LepA